MANLVKRANNSALDFFNADNFFNNNWFRNWEKEFPAVNISENEKNYSVEVVAPGFQKENFKLKVEDDLLTISAESKSDTTEGGKGKDYTRREYSYNSFTRSFHLPENVKDDSISANYKNGILDIELPKSKVQVKASKEIAIK